MSYEGEGGGGGGGTVGDLIILRDQQTQNTQGGTATSGAWQTRALQEITDTGGHCSVSANQFTLAAGTYRIRWSAPAHYCNMHQTRLQNTSDATTTLVGTSEFASNAATTPAFSVQTRSEGVGLFTIASSKTFELQHQVSSTRATDGFGVAANFGTEAYAEVELVKTA